MEQVRVIPESLLVGVINLLAESRTELSCKQMNALLTQLRSLPTLTEAASSPVGTQLREVTRAECPPDPNEERWDEARRAYDKELQDTMDEGGPPVDDVISGLEEALRDGEE